MKTLKAFLALIALFALSTPCAHAEGHAHHDVEEVELIGASVCSECHVLPDEHCTRPKQAVAGISAPPLPGPVQHSCVVRIPEPKPLFSIAGDRRSNTLQFLQTIRLRI